MDMTVELQLIKQLQNDIKCGSGSFGDVYRVKSEETNKEFAIKKVGGNVVNSPEEAKELSISPELTSIKHANIIEFHKAFIENKSRLYLILEYADCGSLFKLLHVDKIRLEYLKIHGLMHQCAKGLKYLHDHKEVHGNLKTTNLLLTSSGDNWILKISDFSALRKFAFKFTDAVNTDAYKAPEVAAAQNTEMSDVYSFGICFWEAISGRKSSHDLANQIEIEATLKERIKKKDEKVEEVVKILIQQCWEKDPKRRPTMKMVSLLLGLQPKPVKATSDVDYKFPNEKK